MSKYTVVIPSKNPENLWECLLALCRNQPDADVVVVADAKRGTDLWVALYLTARHAWHFAETPIQVIQGVQPFCFARNVNLGIRLAGENDVVIMNDDAVLQTPGGLEALSCYYQAPGIMSASVDGFVGNREQGVMYVGIAPRYVEIQGKTLAFICVHIRRALLKQIGLLDERLTKYGWEDNLFCLKARKAGWTLAVNTCCVVEHGKLQSTFRKPGNGTQGLTPEMENREIFERIVREEGLEEWV